MDIVKQLRYISELEDNWDGEGAKAFPKELIDLCERYLSIFPEPVGIFPTMRNTIQFEWEYPNRDYLEFEIDLREVHTLKVLGRDYPEAVHRVVSSDNLEGLLDILNGFIKVHR